MKYKVLVAGTTKRFASLTEHALKFDEQTISALRLLYKIPNHIPREQILRYGLEKGYLIAEGDK